MRLEGTNEVRENGDPACSGSSPNRYTFRAGSNQHQQHLRKPPPPPRTSQDSQWLGGSSAVGLPSRRRAQSEQTPSAWAVHPTWSAILQSGPSIWYRLSKACSKMTLLPSEAVSSSQVLLIKTHFLPRVLSTGRRHLPSTNRLGCFKPLSFNSTPTVHSVMNRLLHWLAGPTFNGQQRRLWSRYNASQAHGTVSCLSNLGTGGPSGGMLAGRGKATCVLC